MALKKILVTGSSGTIGTRLCEILLKKGYDVVGVDCKPNIWSSEIDGLTIRADLRDISNIAKFPKDVSMIIHLAANARVYNLVVKPSEAMDNLQTLFNILEYARMNNISRLIFSSSREVYGNSKSNISHNEDEAYVKNCESPYTASKIGGEALVHSYSQCYGIDFIITRFSNVYGMYDNSDRVIPLFIRLAKENKDLVVFGKDKLLDFTYIDDTIAGIVKCIENFDDVKNDVFNIAYGEGVTLIRSAELVTRFMQKKNRVLIKKNRTGEVVRFIADISKAKKVLGYEPRVDITEGVKRTVDWYMKNFDKLTDLEEIKK